MQQSYRPIQQTILVPSQQTPISSDHPMFYVRQKNYFLEQLSNKVSVNTKFNQMDLKRNVRVDHLIEKHKKINSQIQNQERRRKMFLSSNEFEPIVGESEEEKKRKRELKEAERLRQELYQSYVQGCQIHEAPQKDRYRQEDYEEFKLVKQNEEMKNFTVLSDYRSDRNRRKQLYLIDMQIAKLKQEQNLQKLVKKKQTECQNNQFLSKVSNTILSSYMVYFDEIFNSLMDELLEEEVVYFNGLEAGYYIGESDMGRGVPQNNQNQNQKKTKNYYKQAKDLQADLKAMKMMELVRALDDLAYD